MARKAPSNTPQNRGLITAVALFSVAVLFGVGWVMKRGAGVNPDVLALTPELPSLPSRDRAAIESTASGPREQLGEMDRQTVAYRSRGAIVGRAVALRGDLIQVGDQVFRLVNVDEARGYSHCGPNAYNWPCGTTSQQALSTGIGSFLVACFNRGYNVEREQLGQCFVGSIDLGGWLVEQGMAFAASNRMDYTVKQSIAKRERRGYWFAHQ